MSVVLIAPDSFKGSLTSVEVARALADGWRRARPDDEVVLSPLADGGEGTLAAIEAAGGWATHVEEVRDPRGRKIKARWLQSIDGKRGFVEMAEASGLSRLAANERDAMTATSYGTGELIRAAVDHDVRHLTVGIGGSATTDAGLGLLLALAHRERSPSKPLVERAIEVVGGLDKRLGAVDVEVACDVSNPLLGTNGAAAVYGPQKGATPKQVVLLDDLLAQVADGMDQATGRNERNTAGAGAAGGVGYALLSIQDKFGSFALRPGVELVMDATGFDAKLARASLVITGEGRVDAQTGFGKTALGVAQRAAAAGVPCIAIGGGVEPEGIEALAAVGAIAVPVVEQPQSIDEAMAAGTAPLVRCGERVARLIDLVR